MWRHSYMLFTFIVTSKKHAWEPKEHATMKWSVSRYNDKSFGRSLHTIMTTAALILTHSLGSQKLDKKSWTKLTDFIFVLLLLLRRKTTSMPVKKHDNNNNNKKHPLCLPCTRSLQQLRKVITLLHLFTHLRCICIIPFV